MRKETTKVAIITSNYWPEKTGIGQVTTEFAEFLLSKGVSVSVATATPYYPEWRVADEYRGKLWQTEKHNGVVVHRAAHYAAPDPGTLSRLMHELTLCAFSIPNMVRALRNSREAFIVSPDLSHAFVGSVVARLLRKRINVIVQDVMPDAAIEMGMLRNPVLVAISRWIARTLYASARQIFTLSMSMKMRVERVGVSAEKVAILPNTIDEREFADRPGLGMPFRQRFVPNGKCAVIHAGNMGKKQDLPLLLRAARRLRGNEEIHFYVFGDGAAKAGFLRQREEWDLRNVSHFPLQERELLPHMLYGADVCLISQVREVVDIVVPSKLITAMAAGAMIIAACDSHSETAKVLGESGGGLIVPASDDAALAAAIEKVRKHEVDINLHRTRVREYAVRAFSRESVYSPILRLLESKFGSSGNPSGQESQSAEAKA